MVQLYPSERAWAIDMSEMESKVYKVRDSVDLFLSDNELLTAYFMNTRRRRSFRVNDETVRLLESIDGKKSASELCDELCRTCDANPESVFRTLAAFSRYGIVVEIAVQTAIPAKDAQRYERQINYFSEFFEGGTGGFEAQARLMRSKVVVFGCGAIGGSIAAELVMAGVRNIALVDYDLVEASDVSRHLCHDYESCGTSKVKSLAARLRQIDRKASIEEHVLAIRPSGDISRIIKDADFVVNTIDEPYIGYTSAKISRACIAADKPHYIAGGFDAHLASTGELVIPFETPCVECYANHFKVALKGWKPEKHPVVTRDTKIGGLASMSLFSASYASIEIIRYLAGLVGDSCEYRSRGEWLFDDMSLTYLEVTRDPECPVCGEGRRP